MAERHRRSSVRFEDATLDEQLRILYDGDTQNHRNIVRKPMSNGDGHLPQPVVREETSSQAALRALLEGSERVLVPLDETSDDQVPANEEAPRVRRVGNTIFIE